MKKLKIKWQSFCHIFFHKWTPHSENIIGETRVCRYCGQTEVLQDFSAGPMGAQDAEWEAIKLGEGYYRRRRLSMLIGTAIICLLIILYITLFKNVR